MNMMNHIVLSMLAVVCPHYFLTNVFFAWLLANHGYLVPVPMQET